MVGVVNFFDMPGISELDAYAAFAQNSVGRDCDGAGEVGDFLVAVVHEVGWRIVVIDITAHFEQFFPVVVKVVITVPVNPDDSMAPLHVIGGHHVEVKGLTRFDRESGICLDI